jgi:AcrR family transcriptional regulator
MRKKRREIRGNYALPNCSGRQKISLKFIDFLFGSRIIRKWTYQSVCLISKINKVSFYRTAGIDVFMKRKLLLKEIKERRRKEILETAAEVFAKLGYHMTDLDVIADKLKVGKGTIYRYFPSKQKLFTAVMEQLMEQWACEIRSNIDERANPVDRLKSVIHGHMKFFEKHIDTLEIFVHFRSEYKIYSKDIYQKRLACGLKRMEQTIQEGVDQGLLKPVSAKAVTGLLLDVFYGMLFTTFLGVGDKTFREKGKYLEELLINNLVK